MLQEMRRKDNLLSQEETVAILKNGSYGILSTANAAGEPYGVPVNYCYENGHIYFHGTAEGGMKARNLGQNPNVSFCVIGKAEIVADKFTTRYASAIAFGKAKLVGDPEKTEVLKKFVEKYSAPFRVEGAKFIETLLDKCAVYDIEVTGLSGKAHRV